MTLIGLTGGVGMGKSTTAQFFVERGLPVIDTDQIARDIVEPGQPALREIEGAFGSEVIASDGHLRRDKLARRVFADESARKRLEAITHPRIRQIWRERVAQWREQGRAHAVVVIPLLYETNASAEFGTVICVACSSVTQCQRLRARGWSEEQIAQRIAAQWPVKTKMAQSNFVLWTEAGLDVHREQLDRILRSLDAVR